MRPKGTVDARSGALQVHRPAGVEDGWWRGLQQQLRNVSSDTAEDRIYVPAERSRVLREQLRRGLATAADWHWTPHALRVEDGRRAAVSRLEDVVSTAVEDQRAWPPIDLAALGFRRELRASQRDAVARLVATRGGANFSVPGSGKTTVTYAVYAALKAERAVHAMLVVAPPSAFEAWVEEARECFDEPPRVRTRPSYIATSDEVVVFNYERLADPRVLSAIRRWTRNRRVLGVFDEAHRAKAGRRSARGAASLELAEELDLTMVLTGTPMPNGEDDLASVFDLAWPGHGRRFVTGGDLSTRRDRAFVRVTKADLDMPRMDLVVERIDLTPEHRTLYDAMAARTAEWAAGPAATAADAGRALLRLIAATTNPAAVFAPDTPWGLPLDPAEVPRDLAELVRRPTETIRPAKILRAVQLVDRNRSRGQKTLLWSVSVANVRAVAAALPQGSAAVISGGTPHDDAGAPTDRRRELARFRTDGSCWALVATPQTLGEGISLHHSCTDQIHLDRGYAAGTWLQSIDRTHRLGIPAGVIASCTVLQAVNTVDERVSQVLDRKVAAMADALDDRTLRAVAEPRAGDPGDIYGLLGDVDALRELLHHLG